MATFHLPIFGCQMNVNDAERVRTILLGMGMRESQQYSEADLIIFITCSVRQHAEDRVHGLLGKIKRFQQRSGKRIITGVTGCMVRMTSSRSSEERDPLITDSGAVDFTFRIKEAGKLRRMLSPWFAASEEFYDEAARGFFEERPSLQQRHRGYVPISTGCDHFCTYCIVPYTRGREVFRTREEILRESAHLISEGAQELMLLGQNVNRYSNVGRWQRHRFTTDFAALLEDVAQLEGSPWIRFLSPHPQHLDTDTLSVMAEHSHICSHIHLPLQAGSDSVLRRMARGYTAESFRDVVEQTRSFMPDIAITSDIIVGFPGETEQDFQQTLDMAKSLQFEQIYIGKYSPRPNTPAAEWDNIPEDEKKSRFERLNAVLRRTALSTAHRYHGRDQEVLVDKVDQKGLAHGRNSHCKSVVFPANDRDDLVGSRQMVHIEGSGTPFILEGRLLFSPA